MTSIVCSVCLLSLIVLSDTNQLLLGTFLYNNYTQALDILKKYGHDVDIFKITLDVSDADIEGWIAAERRFLADLKEEPPARVLACAYVEARVAKKNAEYVKRVFNSHLIYSSRIISAKWEAVSTSFRACSGGGTLASNASTTARLKTRRRAAMEGLLVAIRSVEDLEVKLELTVPWPEDGLDFTDTLDYVQQRDYHRALDNIQRLVISRLFEASKANLSQMGK